MLELLKRLFHVWLKLTDIYLLKGVSYLSHVLKFSVLLRFHSFNSLFEIYQYCCDGMLNQGCDIVWHPLAMSLSSNVHLHALMALCTFIPLLPLTRTSLFVWNYVPDVDCDWCVHDCLSMGTMLNGTIPHLCLNVSSMCLHILSLLAWKVQCIFSLGEDSCLMLVCHWTYSSSCPAENMLPVSHNTVQHQIILLLLQLPEPPLSPNIWPTQMPQSFKPRKFGFHRRLSCLGVWTMNIRC